jgi:hypothetical protein
MGSPIECLLFTEGIGQAIASAGFHWEVRHHDFGE